MIHIPLLVENFRGSFSNIFNKGLISQWQSRSIQIIRNIIQLMQQNIYIKIGAIIIINIVFFKAVVIQFINCIQRSLINKSRTTEQILDDLEEIPVIFDAHMIFNLNICYITKKPIRFVVGPKGCSNLNITYEKKAIKDFYSQSIPPSGWPENLLEFKEDNVEEYTGRQAMIDLALKKCIDYWREAKKNNRS